MLLLYFPYNKKTTSNNTKKSEKISKSSSSCRIPSIKLQPGAKARMLGRFKEKLQGGAEIIRVKEQRGQQAPKEKLRKAGKYCPK